ncbi:MAG: hypothetical protein IM574_08720 [Cytophagales bacterium]|jgi:hypothetical protein|nr:hypothetical protein [Cytophagales bacterium]MCA6411955.1 hypothetical protein [Cytophagales bacterium]MCA6433677.1 hypothetical protein [Cytophagales bacterium]
MIEIIERPLTIDEKGTLEKQYGTFDQKAGKVVSIFFVAFVICLLPLLAIDKYLVDVPSNIELLAFIPMIIVSAFATYKIYKFESDGFKLAKEDLDSGTVTVYNIKTSRVFEREDPEDFGPHYYIDLGTDGDCKTLFIWGQYLMDFTFPCTEFELVKTKRGLVIDLIPGGQYLKPERTLKAYSMKDYKEGKVPDDGQLLKITLDEIVE